MDYFDNDYIYDIETYPNLFSFTCVSSDSKEGHIFEISPRKDNRDELFEFLEKLRNNQSRLVGFNNLAFDYPVVHYLLNNRECTVEDIFYKAQELIEVMKDSRFGSTIPTKNQYVKQVDLYKINHFDNQAKATSLKILKFNMRLDELQDLPFEVGSILTDEEIAKVIEYNVNDVVATLQFYKECHGALELRNRLSEKYKIDFTNASDSKIGGEIFIQEIEAAKPNSCYKYVAGKRVPNQTKRNKIYFNKIILPYIEFKRPEFQAILNWFKEQIISETNGVFTDILESDLGDVAKYAEMVVKRSKKLEKEPTEEDLAEFRQTIPFAEIEIRELKSKKKSYYYTWKVAENLNVVINGHKYVFGTGGIHSSISPQVVKSDDEYIIADFDVASYYPNLSIQNTIYPKHLSEQFCRTYSDIFEQRKKYPKNSPENLALKLSLNATYGQSSNQYSPFYDPQYTMTITINGQLSLCMLLEDILELNGASSIQSNTDGITVKILKKDSDKVNELVKNWENVTKLEMERNDYSKMYIRDVNNYVAVYQANNKLKLKGAYVYELEHHKDQSSIVVQKAVANYLENGTSIEEYIKNHKDKYDFMLRTKIPRNFDLVSVDDNGNQTTQQNVTRYYVSLSEKAEKLIKKMPPVVGKTEDREAGICVGRKVKVCNNIVDFDWDIDYDYYVKEAEKLIEFFI